jgi:hypothetical protein
MIGYWLVIGNSVIGYYLELGIWLLEFELGSQGAGDEN